MIDTRTLSSLLLLAGIVLGCGSNAVDDTAVLPGADAGDHADAGDATSDLGSRETSGGNPTSEGGTDTMLDSTHPHDADAEGASSDGPPGDGGGPAGDGPSDARQDSTRAGDAGGPPCTVASDCRTFSDYCGGCTCEALAASQPDPACDGGIVACLVDPCQGHSTVCDPTGRCALQ
jgi:hypothetical protein